MSKQANVNPLVERIRETLDELEARDQTSNGAGMFRERFEALGPEKLPEGVLRAFFGEVERMNETMAEFYGLAECSSSFENFVEFASRESRKRKRAARC